MSCESSDALPDPPSTERRRPGDELKRYRCLVGHLICESLGYFTPRSALHAVLSHRDKKPCACEWYSHIAMCQGKDMFDQEALREINRNVLSQAIQRRHEHQGYMSDYPTAKALIQREVDDEGSTASMLASWF